MSDPIGFIGLGRLGFPVAANLVNAGYALRLYNRTASKADALVARGAERVDRPVDAVTSGGIVVTLLWDDAAVENVVLSDGFLERLGPDGIHISMSTLSPAQSRTLAALHARHGAAYIEAPIFGRPEAAAARQLWIPISGPQSAKARVQPLLTAMGAQGVFDFGEEAGAAAIVKLVGNFLIIAAARSLGEGLAMAGNNGVDPRAVLDMLTQTLFPAPIYQSYGARLAEQAVAFSQNDIPRKDIGFFMAAAQQAAVPTPIAQLLADLLRQ